MTPEERQLIAGLFDRIRAAANTPRDPEAEALIADAVKATPSAPYFLAQAVIVQDQALRAANERLQELESRLNEQQRPASGGFLSSLGSILGGGPQQPRPSSPWQQGPQPPQPQQPYPPGPGPGAWGAPMQPMGGGGFLHGALGTAAGVAGGVLLADSLRSLFGGHYGGGLGIASGPGGFGGGETVVNNYYEDPGQGDFSNADDSYDEQVSDDNDPGTDSGGGDDGTYDV